MQALSELRGVEVDLDSCVMKAIYQVRGHAYMQALSNSFSCPYLFMVLQALSELRGVEVDLDSVQTNIVLFRLPAGNAHKVFAARVHSCRASL